MQLAAWLNEQVADDTVGHRLRTSMHDHGWTAEDVAGMTGQSAGRVRLACAGIGSGLGKALAPVLAPAPTVPRWRQVVDVAVLLVSTVVAIPFAIGWGAKRAMRHDRAVGFGIMAASALALGLAEWRQWVVDPATEWAFRSVQCLLLASAVMLAAGWVAGGLMAPGRRTTLRFSAVGGLCLVPMLAYYCYQADMADVARGTPAAIARYNEDMSAITRRARSEPDFDRVAATYSALQRLDRTLRSRPRSLADLDAFRRREAMASACDALPSGNRAGCLPHGVDAPRPVDRWAVTRDLFTKVVPSPGQAPATPVVRAIPGALAI